MIVTISLTVDATCVDPGFSSRLAFAQTRIAQRRGKVKVELTELAALVAEEGGKPLKAASWSQILNQKQPMSVDTVVAFCRLADVKVGWFLANEGEAPHGYVEAPQQESTARARTRPAHAKRPEFATVVPVNVPAATRRRPRRRRGATE